MAVYLHPESLSPDPLYGRRLGRAVDGGRVVNLYPRQLIRIHPDQAAAAWRKRLDAPADPGPLRIRADRDGRAELTLDFGTELEARLDLVVEVGRAPVNAVAWFGESLPEAEGQGMATTHPLATEAWRISGKGRCRHSFTQRGFRFVRLQFFDVPGKLILRLVKAHAWFAFNGQIGDFRCDDKRLQRVWQSSVYTTRICTRPDSFWDGIKRDRVGWFGDARITQQVADAAFGDPGPSLQMLLRLPTDSWTMGIPGYTFAAIAMFRQVLLWHGTGFDQVPEIYAKMRTVLRWMNRTQLNTDGFIVRDPKAHYFGNVAFVDWSPMPIGGRFEDLSWLQCQLLEGLRMASAIADWLGQAADARRYARQADALAPVIMKRFWRPGRGMIHSLNQTTKKWGPIVVLPLPDTVDNGYRRQYLREPSIGESLPSRHSQSLAVLAGLIQTAEQKRTVLKTLASKRAPPLITAYFHYFQAMARAVCGDPSGAVAGMRDFVGGQLERNDSATVWEWYDPAVQDFRKWGLGDWPKSLCHPFGAGIVPLVQRYVAGIEPTASGWQRARIFTDTAAIGDFTLSVPTPHGPITVACRDGRYRYSLPETISIKERLPERAGISTYK